jgi:hypothetical protein
MVLAFACLTGCTGKTVHLGDGRADASSNGDGTACLNGQVKAGEVLWIGDSWILVPGSQHTHVRDLARAAGAIGPNDDYTIGAVAASTMSAIADQYAAAEAGSTKVKVLIMDGGTWDTIQKGTSDTTVNGVVDTFGQLLAQVASDGTVEHVIYFLMPELDTIPGVAALRPLLQERCAQSTVPCHFLDLQSIWAAHTPPPEYSTAGAILPTDAGARAIADAIWEIMRQNCIAQ